MFQNKSLIEALIERKYPCSGYTVIADVYCRYSLFDENRPLVVTFAPAKWNTPGDSIGNDDYTPWGYKFITKNHCNIISFSCIERDNWYRNPVFAGYLLNIKHHILNFQHRLGYGASMGGYGVGAYARALNLTNVLLLNPISTLNNEVAPWETRYNKAKKLDWTGLCYDGADFDCRGFVVYDPLFNLDKCHATRYKNLTHLKIPGVGHLMSDHLKNLGMLSKLVLDFMNGSVDRAWFIKQARHRRLYPSYYSWLQTEANHHRTPARLRIIRKYQRKLPAYISKNQSNDHQFINALRDAAIALEKTELELSYILMSKAHELRRNGPYIKKKLDQYKRQLGEL